MVGNERFKIHHVDLVGWRAEARAIFVYLNTIQFKTSRPKNDYSHEKYMEVCHGRSEYGSGYSKNKPLHSSPLLIVLNYPTNSTSLIGKGVGVRESLSQALVVA